VSGSCGASNLIEARQCRYVGSVLCVSCGAMRADVSLWTWLCENVLREHLRFAGDASSGCVKVFSDDEPRVGGYYALIAAMSG
jgi:hypothetical protein